MIERRRLRVYVAGPISQGDMFENITSAIRCGKRMVKDGLAPYIPHFDSYMFPGDDISWNAFLEWDLEWMALAEAVYLLPGPSRGAELEVDKAQALGIPVFFGVTSDGYRELLEYANLCGLTGVRT